MREKLTNANRKIYVNRQVVLAHPDQSEMADLNYFAQFERSFQSLIHVVVLKICQTSAVI